MKAELCCQSLPSLCRMETQDLGSWTWRLSATHREACPRSQGQSLGSGPQPLGGRVSAWCVCVNSSCPWRDFWLKGCKLLSADKGAAASLEQKLKEDYKREKEKVNEKPLGMAFVTFHNETITAM